MANTKISELSAVTALTGTDVLPVVDVSANTTNKVSVEDLLRNAPDGTASAPSIANAGDQDTGILFPADNSVGVSTGGTQRLVIDSSGNVGIGNSSPSRTLDVLGGFNTARIQRSGGANDVNLELISGAGNNYSFTSSDAGNLIVKKNGAERLRIDTSGRIIIGGTTPLDSTKQLTLTTTATSGGLGILSPNNGRGDIFFGDAADDNIGQIRYSHVDNSLTIRTNAADRFKIDSSGRIEYGHNTYLTAIDSAGSGYVELLKANASNQTVIANNKNAGIVFVNTNTSELARIDSSGRLLIGDTSSKGSNRKLQVAATDSSAGLELFRYTTEPNSAPSLTLSRSNSDTLGTNTLLDSGDAVGYVQFKAANGSAYNTAAQIVANVDGTPGVNDMPGRLVFSTTTDGASTPTERMRINSGGNVGIGETNVQSTLHVAKNIADSAAISWTNSQLSIATVIGGNSTANRSTLYFAPYGSDNNYAPSAISATAGTSGASTLKFFTNASGNLTGQVQSYERMRITSTGQMRLAGAGITFNGDTAQANELDDYEEGTWTPTLQQYGGSGTNYAVTVNHAKYVKIGSFVYVTCRIQNNTGGAISGAVMIPNAPFSASDTQTSNWYLTGATTHAIGYVTSTNIINRTSLSISTNENIVVSTWFRI